MAQYKIPTGQDPIDFLLRQNEQLKNRVQALEGRRLSTWDRADHTTVAAPAEGQHVVDLDESVWYYSNAAWRELTGTAQIFIAQSTTNVAASWTTLDWTDSGESEAFDVDLFSINAGGNIEIAGPGAYTFDLYSGSWVFAALTSSEIAFTVNAISGSQGVWGSRISSGEIVSQTIGRVNDPADTDIDAAQSMGPDLHGVALWRGSDTFPVEIEVQTAKFQNGALTADTNPTFRLAITRWASTYDRDLFP